MDKQIYLCLAHMSECTDMKEINIKQGKGAQHE